MRIITLQRTKQVDMFEGAKYHNKNQNMDVGISSHLLTILGCLETLSPVRSLRKILKLSKVSVFYLESPQVPSQFLLEF